jgi:ATP-dependent DNA helicase RecQ
MTPEPLSILKKYWGHNHFRPLQIDIIESVLAGKDTLALLPTGGGKSICFQVPALCLGKMCLVISPLIALMQDQVEQLEGRGLRAACLVSALSVDAIDLILEQAVSGELQFLYVSPERLQTELFRVRFAKMQLGLIAVDEAHCVSQWGYDFRPPYLQIAQIRPIHPKVPIIALTATATPQVVEDIADKLAFKHANTFQKSFFRPNIAYQIVPSANKHKDLLELCQKEKGSGIVYLSSRKNVEYIANFLREQGISADFYHAGLAAKERSERQKKWIDNQIQVIVSTNAFGMGIDKPDVRFVAHLDIPQSPEAYFQEAGRGGRDEKFAYAQLFFQDQDIERLEQRVLRNYPEPEIVQKVYQAICNYGKIAQGTGQGSTVILPNLLDFSAQFELSDIYAALKILTLEEYLDFQEQNIAHSRSRILLSREQLILWIRKNTIFAPLIRILVRVYPRILETDVPIYENQIAYVLRKKPAEIINLLQTLHQKKAIDYQEGGQKNTVYFLRDRVSAHFFCLRTDRYYARKEDALKKMQAMKKYVSAKICRSVFLLSYFGEHQGEFCGLCDECLVENNSFSPQDHARFLAWIAERTQWNFQDLQIHFSNIDIRTLEGWVEDLIEKEQVYFDNWWFFNKQKANL